MNIQADALRKRNAPNNEQSDRSRLSVFYNLIPPCATEGQIGIDQQRGERNTNVRTRHFAKSNNAHSDLARSFLRLANLDNGVFERLGRYEMSLWRQTVQIILLLNSINCGAKDGYADCDDKYLHLKNVPRERRRLRWPPFTPSPRPLRGINFKFARQFELWRRVAQRHLCPDGDRQTPLEELLSGIDLSVLKQTCPSRYPASFLKTLSKACASLHVASSDCQSSGGFPFFSIAAKTA
jgi:hypothetical protein